MTSSSACSIVHHDFSYHPYPRALPEMALWEVVIKTAVVAILIVVAVVGNGLIIAIVILSKKMRTTINFYVVNMAVADLLIACIPMWIYVTKNITDGWVLGSFLCKFNAFVQVCATCTLSFTMMAVAGDRFFAIVFPLKARVTHRKIKVMVALIWICSISISCPLLIYFRYTERRWSNYLETFCSEVWPMILKSDGQCDGGKIAEQTYWTVVVAVLNWIPMAWMTVIYTIIIQRLQCSRVAYTGSDNLSTVQKRSTNRVVKMLFMLLITFMVCTIPFQVSTIFEVYKGTNEKLPYWYRPVYFSAITLMYAHSTINPIVYGAMNHKFRTGFRHLMDRLRQSSKTCSAKSQYSNDTSRANISVTNQSLQFCSPATSLTDLVKSSSQVSLAVLQDADRQFEPQLTQASVTFLRNSFDSPRLQ